MVGRGAAFADIDGDGDLDILLTAVGGSPRLLKNEQQLDHHWLRFELEGKRANRDAIGARVEIELDNQVLHRQVMPTRSYLSQCELPVTFGIGKATRIGGGRVIWPGGTIQKIEVSEVDRVYRITQIDE